MINTFFGLNAEQWAEGDGLPFSPIAQKVLTVEDVRAGIVAMLRRRDEMTWGQQLDEVMALAKPAEGLDPFGDDDA